MTTASSGKSIDQIVKWTIYGLLLVNFGYYIVEEIYISSHTLRFGGSLVDWAGEFATTIDVFAWLSLLFLFELETWQLSDEAIARRPVRWSLHLARGVLYLMLAHTVFERFNALMDYEQVRLAPEVTSPCQLAGRDISFGSNYRYTLIDEENCATLSEGERHYFLEPSVVTDHRGYLLEEKHVWVSMIDACTWLIVVLLVELAVRLHSRGVTGRVVTAVDIATKLLYGVLSAHALFWFWVGHWVYAWDQVLWIGGFWVIGRNLSAWRDELLAKMGL
jgi:hypothetical protein